MVTNLFIFFSVWFSFSLFGGVLILFREDSTKLLGDAQFIMTKGAFLHKVTYVLIAIFLLPFSIPRTIEHLIRRK